MLKVRHAKEKFRFGKHFFHRICENGTPACRCSRFQVSDLEQRAGLTNDCGPQLRIALLRSAKIEQRILALQRRKREIADVALGTAAAAAAITREELLELLR